MEIAVLPFQMTGSTQEGERPIFAMLHSLGTHLEERQGQLEIALQGADGFGLALVPLGTKGMIALPGFGFFSGLPDQGGFVYDGMTVGSGAQAIQIGWGHQVADEIAQFMENTALQGDIGTIGLACHFQTARAIANERFSSTGGRNFICVTANRRLP